MARSIRVVTAAVFAAVLVALPAWQGAAQTWKDFLKSTAANAVDGQLGGEAGRIRRVRVVARHPSEITVEARLTDVTDPSSVRLEAELLDNKGNPIEPIVVKHGAIPKGEGTVEATVRYTGSGSVYSSILLLKLVHTSSGKVSSQRSTMVAKSWEGPGEGPVLEDASDRPSPPPTPAPRVVRLHPVPVGNTPKGASAVGIGGLQFRTPPVSPPARTGSPAQVPPPPRRPLSPGAVQLAAGRRATLVDLYRAAFHGSWRNATTALPFNGSDGDRRGFVRALGAHALIDGTRHERVLETHPEWKPHGKIVGEITVQLPEKARHLAGTVGFLPGSRSPDGVTAEVFMRAKGMPATRLWVRRVRPADGAVPFSVTIPREFAGKRVVVELRVDAGPSSRQDWFAWSDLRITD